MRSFLTGLMPFAAIACGSTAPDFTLTGEWHGSMPNLFGGTPTLTLSLQVQGDQVNGTGTLDTAPVTVSGTYRASGSTATLSLTRQTGGVVTYEVTEIPSQVMFGNLRGGGHADVAMIMNRRR